MKNNIILTGGHAATTAIAVIAEIKRRNLDAKLYWVGPRSVVEGKLVPTLASTILPKLGVTYIPITTGRLQRKFSIWTIPSILKVPYGTLQAVGILMKTRPKLIISFGGYAAVPLCFVAWLMRIPIIINEQTVAVGRANKLTAIFAKRILLAREASKEFFPDAKTAVIGLPLASQILKIKAKAVLPVTPTIYVTGGSSGAQRINKAVGEILYELLTKYKVIHQTGKLDYEEFKEKRDQFPVDLRKKYEVYDFIEPTDIPEIYTQADIIVSRAGANTVSEIMAVRRPAILIPIPWTAYDEQTKNAEMAEKTGLAVVLAEKDLNHESLLVKIDEVVKNWEKMVKYADNSLAEFDRGAARRFVNEVEKLLI